MSEDAEFTPPPLTDALFGHFITGAVKAIVIVLAVWLLGFIAITPDFDLSVIVVVSVLAVVVAETAATLVERFFVIRHRHPDPGSIPTSVADAAIPVGAGISASLAITQVLPNALYIAGVITLVYWIFLVCLDRPWVKGDTQEQVHEKYEATKAMTRDLFDGS